MGKRLLIPYKIGNAITFKIKKGYYLEILSPETIILIRSTKNKITENENGQNVPHLEITEAVLVHWNIFNNIIIINKIQESCIYLFIIDRLVNY